MYILALVRKAVALNRLGKDIESLEIALEVYEL
jgi:hypothetical protein